MNPHSPPKLLGSYGLFYLVQNHTLKILLHIGLLTLAPFVYVLVQSIIWPGPLYCKTIYATETTVDYSCPDSDSPPLTDWVSILIVLILYVYCVCWDLLLLLAPGFSMDSAFGSKIFVLFDMFLILFSSILVISPSFSRGYVYPFELVEDYTVVITQKDSETATFTFCGLWGTAGCDFTNNSIVANFPANATQSSINNISIYDTNSHVLFQVFEASGEEDNIRDLSPLQQRIYKDDKYGDTTKVEINGEITRTVGKLKHGSFYFVMVGPARKGVNGGAYNDIYLKKIPSDVKLHLLPGEIVSDGYIDQRAYFLCKWDSAKGCVVSY